MPEPGQPQARWRYIGHLFVRSEHRTRGVGTALIRKTIAIADRRRYEKLLVSPTSAALSMFCRAGFLMMDEVGPEQVLLLRPGAGAPR